MYFLRFAFLISSVLFLSAGCQTSSLPSPKPIADAQVSLPPAHLDYPPAGTRITYERRNSDGTSSTWDGIVTNGDFRELTSLRTGNVRSLLPGCLLHCNQSTHPITLDRYKELFPLKVGNKALFVRQRADGSAPWRHQIEVTGMERIDSEIGVVDVFVIKSDIRGISGESVGFWGQATNYWSPDHKATIREINTGRQGTRQDMFLMKFENELISQK